MAGLSACWAYRKGHPEASVLMLDQHPIFGGEAKQNEFEVDGYHLTAPQGATGIVVPFKKAKDAGMWTHFATDLGFPDEFVFQKPSGLSRDILVPEDGQPKLLDFGIAKVLGNTASTGAATSIRAAGTTRIPSIQRQWPPFTSPITA